MKESDKVVFGHIGIVLAIFGAIAYFFPSAPWYVYAFFGLAGLMSIPMGIKNAAQIKAAKKILDGE